MKGESRLEPPAVYRLLLVDLYCWLNYIKPPSPNLFVLFLDFISTPLTSELLNLMTNPSLFIHIVGVGLRLQSESRITALDLYSFHSHSEYLYLLAFMNFKVKNN